MHLADATSVGIQRANGLHFTVNKVGLQTPNLHTAKGAVSHEWIIHRSSTFHFRAQSKLALPFMNNASYTALSSRHTPKHAPTAPLAYQPLHSLIHAQSLISQCMHGRTKMVLSQPQEKIVSTLPPRPQHTPDTTDECASVFFHTRLNSGLRIAIMK